MKFSSDWEPTLLEETIVATGTWWDASDSAWTASLFKRRYDYVSKDLVGLISTLDIPQIDYIDCGISDEGVLYQWNFECDSRRTISPSFSTYFTARDHINTYVGRHDINWL